MWMNMVLEVHGWSVSEPLIADGYFCVTMANDISLKNGGRVKSTELCVYAVNDGKIISERFFHR